MQIFFLYYHRLQIDVLNKFRRQWKSVEILSVNGFIEWSANISGLILGLFCIVLFFICWLAFVFSENLCVAEEL